MSTLLLLAKKKRMILFFAYCRFDFALLLAVVFVYGTPWCFIIFCLAFSLSLSDTANPPNHFILVKWFETAANETTNEPFNQLCMHVLTLDVILRKYLLLLYYSNNSNNNNNNTNDIHT